MESAGNESSVIETDAVVIGAGPVGLFQVFELGLLEIDVHVVDSLPYPGGQCIELYPDKPIYDIPGVPVVSGRELIANLLKQLEPFEPEFHLGQEVGTLHHRDDGRFYLETSTGTRFLTKTIFIAAGVGAFQPKLLKVEGVDKFHGSQLHYMVRDPANFAGKHLVIVGGDDAAVDWANTFAEDGANKAASVTLVHRRDVFQAKEESVAKMRAHVAANRIKLDIGQITGVEEAEGKLAAVLVTAPDASTHSASLDSLLVFFGLSPKLGPIADWGLDIERKQVQVNTETFSTNIPGVFAVGDINTYPGKKKLILSGFHECALASFGAASLIFPDKKVLLQYTTTSPRLHKLLGVQGKSSEQVSE